MSKPESAVVKLTNAARMSREHPEAFWRPNRAQLRDLKVGDVVKVCDAPTCSKDLVPERFWVLLKARGKFGWIGEINNYLQQGKSYTAGAVIKLRAQHIYQIYDDQIAGHA